MDKVETCIVLNMKAIFHKKLQVILKHFFFLNERYILIWFSNILSTLESNILSKFESNMFLGYENVLNGY